MWCLCSANLFSSLRRGIGFWRAGACHTVMSHSWWLVSLWYLTLSRHRLVAFPAWTCHRVWLSLACSKSAPGSSHIQPSDREKEFSTLRTIRCVFSQRMIILPMKGRTPASPRETREGLIASITGQCAANEGRKENTLTWSSQSKKMRRLDVVVSRL